MIRYLLTGVALASLATPALAASDAATRFGARDSVQQVSISPDGKSLAIIQPTEGRGAALLVANLGGAPSLKPILESSGAPDRLQGCRWSSNTRLVCNVYMIGTVYGDRTALTRLIAINADGSGLKQLSARAKDTALGVALGGGDVIDWGGGGSDSGVLMERFYIPEQSTGTIISESREGLGVDRVDTDTLSRRTIEPPNMAAIGYISDGRGVVRIRATRPSGANAYGGKHIDYAYRKKGSREWLPLDTTTLTGDATVGFVPQAVDPDLDVVYGAENQDGRTAIYKIALDGSLKKNLVFERPDVDVDDLVEVGRQSRVVGASFVTDKRQTAFFDPTLKQFAASLSKAIPGLPLVSFVDASADESKLVLWAGSDTDPGHFYLFDKATKQLTEIMPVRPQLSGVTLAKTVPITFPAADGTSIPAYLTLPLGSSGKNLPGIVMPHGGPEARDEWQFDWLAQFFANRGYAVLQPNYRGSTGYGDAWFVKNGFRSWKTAIGDVDDGGKWLVKQGTVDPNKLAIFGWSYGGYAALQSPALDPNLFKAIVAVAPVTDLEALARQEKLSGENPDLIDERLGKGQDAVAASPATHAEAFVAPVLLFHGDVDQNVPVDQSREMDSRLKSAGKKVEFVEYHGLDHQLDDSAVRAEMLDKADAFLRASMGLKPGS